MLNRQYEVKIHIITNILNNIYYNYIFNNSNTYKLIEIIEPNTQQNITNRLYNLIISEQRGTYIIIFSKSVDQQIINKVLYYLYQNSYVNIYTITVHNSLIRYYLKNMGKLNISCIEDVYADTMLDYENIDKITDNR